MSLADHDSFLRITRLSMKLLGVWGKKVNEYMTYFILYACGNQNLLLSIKIFAKKKKKVL
jgi:hypothetical protein